MRSALTTLSPKHLAFAAIHPKQLEFWKAAKLTKCKILGLNMRAVETVYVSLDSIKEKARIGIDRRYDEISLPPRIWAGMPGFMSQAWMRPTYRKYNFRFNTGHYHCSGELLFIDDLIAWAHYHIKEEKKIRTCFDIIKAVQSGKLTIDS